MEPILFFDGICGLCNGFVDWLVRVDRRGVYRVATLQGETAARLLPTRDRQALESVVLRAAEGEVLRGSAAVLRVLRDLGGVWSVLGRLGGIAPASVRDSLYGWVARRRYAFSGRRDTCRLPTPEERSRFLP